MNYYFAYVESLTLRKGDPSFYAYIMAAMRKADTNNLNRLKAMWPDVWDELQARYIAPGGVLDTDPERIRQAAGLETKHA